ncbi:MAG: hypothetical protein K5666_01685, partial [Bacilli bacterium]|nr:hypothetical protein [Bacilli bacterium]
LILGKDSLRVFLKTAMNMAKYQNKLTPYDEMIFNDVIKYLKECELIIPTELYKEVKMDLPNSWYITPHNHLYNTLGLNGHKEANLIYPFYYDILTNENFSSGKGLLKRIRTILKDGAIEKRDFDDYTHLIYDFPSVFSEEYYDLPNDKKLAYKCFYRKSYNPKIVNLIVGILSAQASLYEFFYYLKNTSNDYQADINYLKQFSLDEILVRCCGFHKIISPVDKMISTSDVNYQEDFAEYIKQGWHIDFVKPIVLNSSGRLEELTDDFMNIRNFIRD